MIYTQETFRQFCKDAAKQFLQTVVVIDNEAVFDMDRILKEASEKRAADEVNNYNNHTATYWDTQ